MKQKSSISQKIDHVLSETRVVLPGAQALIGFQFIAIFSDRFNTLASSLQYLHMVSLLLIMVCVIFLMAPAAYHRIAQEGEDSEEFHTIASYMILIALLFLGIGLSLDLFITAILITQFFLVSCLITCAILVVFYSLLVVYPLIRHEHAIKNTGVRKS
ncbi:MAG TPA: DUF6328 family protein [Candidatus Eisenbacteria bacterium]|nr:DUF6328 family protein [Candidatus Eisenbacteria bacterium]